ncbi:MAG: hypothetical protein WC686_04185 [Candidatus Shapirobacteria bacterium]|jgi:hypothetical protein
MRTIGIVLGVALVVALFVWPGIAFGHPVWGPWPQADNASAETWPAPDPTDAPAADPAPAAPETAPAASTAEDSEETIWSDPDAVDSTSAEYPLGDSKAWTYVQAWNTVEVTSTVHFVVAPGWVVRMSGYTGTRYQIWGKLPLDRLAEMAKECQSRDKLPFIPQVVVIDDNKDPDIGKLPRGWSIQPFPRS